MSHVRGYGYLPDLPDQRDGQFARVPKPRAAVPASLDLRSKNYGIDDQGQFGSCVGHGTEGAFRNLLAHEPRLMLTIWAWRVMGSGWVRSIIALRSACRP